MERKIEKKITFTLILNKTEAVWLKALIQNPINGVSLDEEDEFDKEMRKTFWESLTID